MHISQGVKACSLPPSQRFKRINLTQSRHPSLHSSLTLCTSQGGGTASQRSEPHRPHPSPHSSLTICTPCAPIPSHPKAVAQRVNDPNLKLVLSFGIGMHHAGLREGDRKIVEELFTNRKIQILVATSTLAWGINMPAHLGQSFATPFGVSVMVFSNVPFPHFACRVFGVCVCVRVSGGRGGS